MKRKTRNPEKTKQEIIEKASPIFNQHGIAGTKMDMLIKATGFQKGGIYCHFKSKADLASAVFKYNLQLLKANYQKEIAQETTPKGQLLAYINGFKKFVFAPPLPGGCPLLNMVTEADDTDEPNRLIAKNFINDWKNDLAVILQKGIDSGVFQSTINPTQEALFIIASIEGSIMLGQAKRSGSLMISIADSLQRYMEVQIFK